MKLRFAHIIPLLYLQVRKKYKEFKISGKDERFEEILVTRVSPVRGCSKTISLPKTFRYEKTTTAAYRRYD
jgi:hypothetical protein